jgi:hypothetical protein
LIVPGRKETDEELPEEQFLSDILETKRSQGKKKMTNVVGVESKRKRSNSNVEEELHEEILEEVSRLKNQKTASKSDVSTKRSAKPEKKITGRLDPYSYIPLNPAMLNRRKQKKRQATSALTKITKGKINTS